MINVISAGQETRILQSIRSNQELFLHAWFFYEFSKILTVKSFISINISQISFEILYLTSTVSLSLF